MRLYLRLAFAAITLLGMYGTAMAADMPLKASPLPPPIASWTGWYAGLNAGGGWGDNDPLTTSVTGTTCNPIFAGCFLAPVNSSAAALAASIPPQIGIRPSGFIGGVQIP